MRTNLSEIRTLRGRITQGVTIFSPRSGDSVSSIACVSELDLEEDDKTKLNGSTNDNKKGGSKKKK